MSFETWKEQDTFLESSVERCKDIVKANIRSCTVGVKDFYEKYGSLNRFTPSMVWYGTGSTSETGFEVIFP